MATTTTKKSPFQSVVSKVVGAIACHQSASHEDESGTYNRSADGPNAKTKPNQKLYDVASSADLLAELQNAEKEAQDIISGARQLEEAMLRKAEPEAELEVADTRKQFDELLVQRKKELAVEVEESQKKLTAATSEVNVELESSQSMKQRDDALNTLMKLVLTPSATRNDRTFEKLGTKAAVRA